MKHTPGPWEVEPVYNFGISREGDTHLHTIAQMRGSIDKRKTNARRIVACVNACEGMNPEAVPELLEALMAVEWIPDDDIPGQLYCPWCGNYEHHGHISDCQRQTAIAKATETAL